MQRYREYWRALEQVGKFWPTALKPSSMFALPPRRTGGLPSMRRGAGDNWEIRHLPKITTIFLYFHASSSPSCRKVVAWVLGGESDNFAMKVILCE
jgi:hypothetical protein